VQGGYANLNVFGNLDILNAVWCGRFCVQEHDAFAGVRVGRGEHQEGFSREGGVYVCQLNGECLSARPRATGMSH
jgi:hypothetical protein